MSYESRWRQDKPTAYYANNNQQQLMQAPKQNRFLLWSQVRCEMMLQSLGFWWRRLSRVLTEAAGSTSAVLGEKQETIIRDCVLHQKTNQTQAWSSCVHASVFKVCNESHASLIVLHNEDSTGTEIAFNKIAPKSTINQIIRTSSLWLFLLFVSRGATYSNLTHCLLLCTQRNVTAAVQSQELWPELV